MLFVPMFSNSESKPFLYKNVKRKKVIGRGQNYKKFPLAAATSKTNT